MTLSAAVRSTRSRNEEESSDSSFENIGDEFQADITEYNPLEACIVEDKDICVWQPSENNLKNVDEYISNAKSSSGYNIDQALALYKANKYNLEASLEELPRWTPLPKNWKYHDKLLYEQASRYCNKNFGLIQQLMPHKSIGELITYYYDRKILKHANSHFDILYKKLNKKDIETSFVTNSKHTFLYENPRTWKNCSEKTTQNDLFYPDFKLFYQIWLQSNDSNNLLDHTYFQEVDNNIYDLKCKLQKNQQKLSDIAQQDEHLNE